MGRYRARDLVNAPTLVSWLRIPLAAAFPFVRESVSGSLVVLGLAAATDVIDGFIARRFGLATPTGAVVDGVTDKTFAATVLGTLVLPAAIVATITRSDARAPLLWFTAAIGAAVIVPPAACLVKPT